MRAFASHLSTALALASTAMYPLSKELMPRNLAAITASFVHVYLTCPVREVCAQSPVRSNSWGPNQHKNTQRSHETACASLLVFYSTRQAEPKPTLVHNTWKAMLR